METLRLALPGGDALLAQLYRAAPECRRGRSVVVAPATAVPQTYYAPFCRYLAEQGFDVIGFDFRGVAQSRLRPIREYADIGFSDWATQDYPAVIGRMHALFPAQPLYIVGHSVGGWMPGVTQAMALCQDLEPAIRDNVGVAFHCRGGLGRTGTALALMLNVVGYYCRANLVICRVDLATIAPPDEQQ